MITVTSLGLIGLAGKVPMQGMVFIVAGVVLIFIGMSKIWPWKAWFYLLTPGVTLC